MFTIVALLTIRDAEAFQRFERQAIAIMAEHGGLLDSAFRPRAAADGQPPVDEVHVLKFPDEESFERYRLDARLTALAELRATAISATTIYLADREIDYGP